MSVQVYPRFRGQTPVAYASYSDSSTQNLTSSAVTYVKFNTVEAQQYISVQNDGLGNPTKIVVADSGVFSFTLSPQLIHGGGGSTIVDFWVEVNGAAAARTASRLKLPNNTETLPYIEIVLTLAAGDAVQWAFYTTGTNVSIYATAAAPPIPAAPSAIASVKQIQ